MKRWISFALAAVFLLACALPAPAAAEEEQLMPAAALTDLALGKNAEANNVYQNNASFTANKVTDGDSNTRWASDAGLSEYWIGVDLEQPSTVNQLYIDEYAARIEQVAVLYSNDNSAWKTAFEGGLSGTATSNHRANTVSFPSVRARYVRLLITKTTSEPTIWTLSLFYDAAKDETANLAQGRPVTASSVHSADFAAEKAVDGNKTTRWSPKAGDPIPDPDEKWIAVDLGRSCPVNKITLLEFKDRIKEYKIQVSDSGQDGSWQEAAAGTLSGTNGRDNFQSEIVFPAVTGRFIRLVITAWNDIPSLYELSVSCNVEAGLFYQYYMAERSLEAEMITSEPLDAITGNIHSPLPERLTEDLFEADLIWGSSDDAVVNVSTGAVTRTDADQEAVISVELIFTGAAAELPAIYTEFPVTVKAEPRTQQLCDQAFDASLPEAVEAVDGTVSIEEGALKVTGGEALLHLPALMKQFTPLGTVTVELELSSRNTVSNKVAIQSGGVSAVTAQFTQNKLALAYGNPVKTWEAPEYHEGRDTRLKFVVDTLSSRLRYAYLDTGRGYVTAFSEKSTAAALDGLDRISLLAEEGGAVYLKRLTVSLEPTQVYNMLEKQFSLCSVTNQSASNLTQPLELYRELFGAAVQWASSRPDLIDPETGAVAVPDEVTEVRLSAVVSLDGQSFERSFPIMMGLGNVLDGAKATSTANASASGPVSNLTDGNQDTYFLTREKENYSITITLDRPEDISSLMLYQAPEETAPARITSFRVMASADGKHFTEVYQGGPVGDALAVQITPQTVRAVQIEILEKGTGASGISEIYASLKPDDGQKVAGDIAWVTVPESITGSFTLPAKGKFGSDLVWSSSQPDVVTFDRNGELYHASVNLKPVTVTLTVRAQSGDRNKSRGFQVPVQSAAKPSSPGGGNGSSSGGRGGSSSTGIVPIIPDVPDRGNQPEQPGSSAELKGHWAEQEINYLIEQKIINGDGSSLNLGEAVTRAEFAAMLIRGMGLQEEDYSGSFSDVGTGDWYDGVVQTAADNGLINGFDGRFRPNETVTREEMAKMLMAAYQMQNGGDWNEAAQTKFTDMDTVSPWAAESVLAAAELGLVHGYENGAFGPKESTKREQAMVVLYRLMNR